MPFIDTGRESSRSVSGGHRRMLTSAVFLAVAAVYWFGRGRNPGWGDGLGFLIGALDGFSWPVNATGHFLYNTLNVFILRLFPSADPVCLLTAVSLVSALLALAFVYQTAMLVTGDFVASLAGMLSLAFSFVFWRHAVSIEVYAPYVALVAAFIRYAVPVALDDRRVHSGAGVFFALALLVHIETCLLLPAFVVWMWFAGWRRREVLAASFCVVAAFFTLIIAAAVNPRLTVASVFVDFQFAENVFGFSPDALLRGGVRSIGYLLYNFHLFLPLMVIGAVRLYRHERWLFVFSATVFIPVWGFAFRYTVSDNYVFFLSAYLVLALVAASGFSVIIDAYGARRWLPVVVLATAFAFSPVVYGTAVFSATRLPGVRELLAPVAYKGGAAYYLWPGMRGIPDPLAVVHERYPGGQVPPGMNPSVWGNIYPRAVEYLRRTGGLPAAAGESPSGR